MDVRMEAKDGAPVAALPETLAVLSERLAQEQHLWRERLLEDPSCFGDLEVAVHDTFQQLADQVVAGLLAEVGRQPVLEDACKKSY